MPLHARWVGWAGWLPAVAMTALGLAALGAVGVLAQTSEPVEDGAMTPRQMYCLELEQQLGRISQDEGAAEDALQQIASEIRKYDEIYQVSRARLEQADCYDYFLFSKTLRETPRCLKLVRQMNNAAKMLERLEARREKAQSREESGNRRETLVAELARNRCGPQYQQEAKRNSGSGSIFWSDDESADPGLGPFGLPAGQTGYRTVCVRLCDGFFFPISYQTSADNFERDSSSCMRQCAAPARLYVYQNPGSDVEQATSVGGQPYTKLKTAWRYRKEFVEGCSCKQAEYSPELLAQKDGADATAEDGGVDLDATATTGDPTPEDAAGSFTFGATPDPEPPLEEEVPVVKKKKTAGADDPAFSSKR